MPVKPVSSWIKSHKAALILGAAVLILVVLFLVVLLNPAYAPTSETLSLVQGLVEKQQSTEASISAYLQNGKFTFADPLVIQDPYGRAPLTALVIFDTLEAAQISIHVPGKTPAADVDFTFAGYQQHHELPIYGLYPGLLNQVTLSLKTQAGASDQTVLSLQTEPLPVYLQSIQVNQVDRARYSPGFNFTFLEHKMIFDIDGVVRWYSTQTTFHDFTPLHNGHYLYTVSFLDQKNMVMLEQDLLGKVYAVYNITDGIHHDIYELPNGNLLLTSEDARAGSTEDFILELDRQSGYILRSFDLKNYLDPNRPHEIDFSAFDWLHFNSIIYDASDSSIIISSRSQSAVVKFSYPDMKIQWILGSHDNWSSKYQPYLLTPLGDNFQWPWSQHHATLYGPNLPGDDIVDIQLFDNGLFRSFDPARVYSAGESYSRVVHYRINEQLRTVTQIWEYGKARGVELFANSLGSSYLLANGNVLGNWGDIDTDLQGNPLTANQDNEIVVTKVIEVDPASSAVVFESTLPAAKNYRTLRAGFYDGYSAGSAYLSARLNDTSGSDLIDRGALFGRDALRWLDQQILSLKRLGRKILGSGGA
jgi:arylsulfate sulfotransferase